MKKYLLFLLCFGVLACQNKSPSKNDFLRTWLGKSEADLVATWGAPANMETMPNGNQIFTYIKERSRQNDFGGKLIYYCEVLFETKDDIIFDYSVRGMNCFDE